MRNIDAMDMFCGAGLPEIERAAQAGAPGSDLYLECLGSTSGGPMMPASSRFSDLLERNGYIRAGEPDFFSNLFLSHSRLSEFGYAVQQLNALGLLNAEMADSLKRLNSLLTLECQIGHNHSEDVADIPPITDTPREFSLPVIPVESDFFNVSTIETQPYGLNNVSVCVGDGNFHGRLFRNIDATFAFDESSKPNRKIMIRPVVEKADLFSHDIAILPPYLQDKTHIFAVPPNTARALICEVLA